MRLASGGRLWPMLIVSLGFLSSCPATLGSPNSPQTANTPTALEVLGYDLAANQDKPELCFVLSESIARRPSTPLETFVAVEPAATLAAIPRKDRLCVTGLIFGSAYTISLKSGLPGVSSTLAKDVQFRIEVPNRPPELDFAAEAADILPRIGVNGLPIRSVNVPKIDIQIFHVADANLSSQPLPPRLTAAQAAAFASTYGERVWQGSVEPKNDPNVDTVTMLPIEQWLGTLKPGLYIAVAMAAGVPPDGRALPTQYFAVSDTGLSAYRGPDSLLVAVRSLSSAAASPGIDVALVAANNRELGRIRTDGNGFARFDSNLLHGAGGDRPLTIFAYGPAGEFATLKLGAEASEGQHAQVALIHADRAAYRLGETVNILVLLRNSQGAAITKQPISVNVVRPDNGIFNSQILSDQGAGSYNTALTIPQNAPKGMWRIEVRNEADKNPIGRAAFEVAGGMPSRLSLTLNADVAIIDPAQPANVALQVQYPTGPAPNVPGAVAVSVGAAAVPFPAFPDFSFGLADENIPPLVLDPIHFMSDLTGKADLPIKFALPPKAPRPLEAVITGQAFDTNGRKLEKAISIPIATQSLLLGVKAETLFAAGQSAHFEIIAVSPDGARQEKSGIGWEILREDTAPSWAWDGGRFAYRPAIKDSHIAGGMVDIPTNAAAILDSSLTPGRYRIEIFDPDGEAITSRGFIVGWAPRRTSEAADSVAIKSAKPYFTPGDTADIFVQPPFDADLTLNSADPQIRETIVQHIPTSGATIRLPIARDIGLGILLTATAVAPPDPSNPGLTRRAVGQTVLLSDPTSRNLDVALNLPQTLLPQRTLSVPVTISGNGDEPVYVRVSAIDERSESDSPASDSLLDPLIAQQMSIVSVSDNYGRIIATSGRSSGEIAMTTPTNVGQVNAVDRGELRAKPLALYSGIVTLDKDGKGNVLLTVPDFAGKLKVKALAWTASRFGQSEAHVTIRYPLDISLTLPDFLATDDHADVTLAVDNADGSRGEYRVVVHGEGAISVQDQTEAIFNLAEHEQRSMAVSLQAHSSGEGAVVLGVKGPNGIAFERRLPITVRPVGAMVTRRAVVTVKAGGTLSPDPALNTGLRPDTIATSLTAGSDTDAAGIARELMSVDRDSAEQIVDAATPLLAPAKASVASDFAQAAPSRLGQAVQALAAYQGGDGGFSLFGEAESDPWLTAYVTDFLSRAKGKGAAVPDILLRQALNYLAGLVEPLPRQADYPQQKIGDAAYAAKVLTANGRMNLYELRYFADSLGSQTRNPIIAGLIASAFANLGDKAAAAANFAIAGSLPIDPSLPWLMGSDLRDQAMLTAFMTESGAVAQPTLAANMTKLGMIAATHRQFSSQEASWIFRAMAAQPPSEIAVKLKIGDRKIDQGSPFSMDVAGQSLPPIKNNGDSPLRIAITATGLLAASDPKDQTGYELQRWFFDTTGKVIDPGTLHQGDIAVIVLTGRFTGQGEAHPLISDITAAGWEIEAATISNPIGRYPWLKDLSGASYAAAFDGRYISVPRLIGERHEFKLAYIVRAAVRGQFNLPGTLIEDMAQPGLSARVAPERVKIDAAP